MDSLPINAVDVLVVLVLVISALIAFLRGFSHELLSIVSWVGATFATLYGFPLVQPYARAVIPIELLADVIAGVVIFIVVLVVLSIATRVVANFIQESSLGPLDRSLGLVFGLLRGFVIACLAWLAFDWLLPREDWPGWVEEARARPALVWGSELLAALAPEDLRQSGEEAADEAIKNLNQLKETEAAFESLNNALSKSGEKSSSEGYNQDQRQELERLIDDVGEPGQAAE
jgi:membrane protein required for colicin V production